MQLFNDTDLFPSGETKRTDFEPPDAKLTLYEYFFDKASADDHFRHLLHDTPWRQGEVKVYNQTHLTPRLVAWYGDAAYTYSGVIHQPLAWTDRLLSIKQKIEKESGVPFNSVLMNLYRDGRDSMGWHRDNEKELGTNPVIGSVSFGETRPFRLRHKFRKEVEPLEIPLAHGSYLLMAGATQQYWEHMIPKTARPLRPRINLTFRLIR